MYWCKREKDRIHQMTLGVTLKMELRLRLNGDGTKLPKIVDFGLAHQGDGGEPFRHPIQPPLYHAPEVLLVVPWSYSADIWNLGVLRDELQLFELLENKELFANLKSHNGVYTAQAHLAEMIALLGLPPRKLIDQENLWRNIPWDGLGAIPLMNTMVGHFSTQKACLTFKYPGLPNHNFDLYYRLPQSP
ncbi:uncharacterized protein RAG0_17057 [Rhynchosporium agropyri]|uniref:Protein kinase domain-containing protein n=1 Tax=Rhynchosporium agropyri TaxID=914238 RepID=A0A1E1LSY1_9HELO|nr:uncharacterized protein RAG0_17057 [Rhynchosporium agropyri]